VEPFPRAKIMKTCYHIMEQLSKGFPETSIYRIYNEERTKYFMKIVDETTDIEELEDHFGVETIELFIDNLVGQLEIINIMRHSKIWEMEDRTDIDEDLIDSLTPQRHVPRPAYRKPEKSKVNFVEE
jgi:NADH dehydrogenase (ubiquinone) 1 alpha subcomplex subunit 5